MACTPLEDFYFEGDWSHFTSLSREGASSGPEALPRVEHVFQGQGCKADTGQELSHWLRCEGQRRLDSARGRGTDDKGVDSKCVLLDLLKQDFSTVRAYVTRMQLDKFVMSTFLNTTQIEIQNILHILEGSLCLSQSVLSPDICPLDLSCLLFSFYKQKRAMSGFRSPG